MKVENEFLRIQIKDIGSELSSLFNKTTNTELLWQGDANFWSGQAPILFPIVGMLKEGKYIHKGKTYELPRHGLARRSNQWKIEKISDVSIKGTLVADSGTAKVYPFNFKLEVIYSLEGSTLKISHKVSNLGAEKMPFSIGGHPAFNCPVNDIVSYSDYSLQFEKEENSERHFINKDGLFAGDTELILEDSDTLQLTDSLFKKDALVFQDLKSEAIILVGPNGKIVKVSYSDFETIGVWAKPGAPFVCIEPWIGYSDTTGSTQNLFDKKGSKVLLPNHTFEANYTIECY